MIIEGEVIYQPMSGEFRERIYDKENIWNSQDWTFIKFTNDDFTEWCGHFRGFPGQIAISTARNIILVLTPDYLYQIDRETGNLMDLEGTLLYKSLTVTPEGDFILEDGYNIDKITDSVKYAERVESPVQMDNIKFGNWLNSKLEFTCEELMNWQRNLIMSYDSQNNIIQIERG